MKPLAVKLSTKKESFMTQKTGFNFEFPFCYARYETNRKLCFVYILKLTVTRHAGSSFACVAW